MSSEKRIFLQKILLFSHISAKIKKRMTGGESVDGAKSPAGRGPGIKENKMGVMPVGKLLFVMALPMVISMLMQAMYNIVDSMFVGMISLTDDHALTALSLAFPIQHLMIAFASGTGVGINAYLSRSLGEKNGEAVNRSAGNGLLLIFLTNILFILFGVFGTRLYFGWVTSIPEVYEYGVDYMFVVTAFSIGLFFQVTFERLLQSTGKTMLSMASQLTGAIINIILDPIFILNKGTRIFFFDLPFGLGLGTRGAAIATVIGQCAAALLGLYLNLRHNKEISFGFRYLKPQKKIIATIYKVGAPSIFMMAVGSFLTMALNGILTLGEAVKYAVPIEATKQIGVTVYGAYFKLQSFIFMPVFGLNNGMIPIVAYNFGARRKKRIVKTILLAVIAAVSYMLFGVAIFELFPAELLSIFSITPEAMEVGVTALREICLCFIFAGVCIITISSLQALGRGVSSLIISLIRQIVVILPLSYIFAVTLGLDYVWYAFPIAEGVALIISVFVFGRTYKKLIAPMPERVENKEPEEA